ncbi:hypothetical protein OROHE_017140 [Orobanche hederae]
MGGSHYGGMLRGMKIALYQRMSSVIMQSFKRIANPTGFSWKLIPQPVKLQFFDEFRRAGDLGRQDYCSKEIWTGLCDYWDIPEASRRSEAARKNRMSEPGEPGSRISKHRGGSKSVEILAPEMAVKEGIPAEKCIYSSFKFIHTKKDDTFLTHKARKINAQVIEIAAEQGYDADLSEIYLDIMGRHLDKKKGCLAQCDKHYSQIQGELDLELERRQRLEEEMQGEWESRQRLEEQVQATHQMMQEFLMQQSGGTVGGTSFPPPSAFHDAFH